MSENMLLLASISYIAFCLIIIIVAILLMNRHYAKKYKLMINELERNKNLIVSASVIAELNKVEALINNVKLRETYEEWVERFSHIKDLVVPKLTDELIEIENLYELKDYKELDKRLALIEFNICLANMQTNYLLKEIKAITLSEERNRDTVTKLKKEYRDLLQKYQKNKNDYSEINTVLELQFENIEKLFAAFETAMSNNAYSEVSKIVKGLDDLIGNLSIVIEEAPSIILMGKKIIPRKITDIKDIYDKMTKDGYPLYFLNIEYNVEESEKKLADIFARLNVLNLEDSIFELKTILDYFESIYQVYEREHEARKSFDENQRTIAIKQTKLEGIIDRLHGKLADIQYTYDLSDAEIKVVDYLYNEVINIKTDYELLMASHHNKTFPYSKLAKEMEMLNMRLFKTEDKLDMTLRTLGSLKEDELRAREQLDEIKKVLKEAKTKTNSYKLPIIPSHYYVELAEATEAIKEINKELEKQPISIKILNTRVDTARDLVLKLYKTANELVKTAYMSEMAIVYGNRYRPVMKEIDAGLTKAENHFWQGQFRQALEYSINAISIIEPKVHERLLASYQNK